MKDGITIQLDKDIFNSNILELIDEEIKNYKSDKYYGYDYDLNIQFNDHDIINKNLNEFDFNYSRPWHKNYNYTENLELVFRITISEITKCLEYNNLNIRKIFVQNNEKIEHTEIKLTKIGLHDYDDKRKTSVKFHLDMNLANNISIFKILDLITYDEYDLYIDERNNNKNFYNSLLLKKEQGLKLDINSLSEQDWKQLILKEKTTNREIANLYDIKESIVTKTRKNFISNVRWYSDEYLFYYLIINAVPLDYYYSNFCIILLEKMKSNKMKVIYEYLNLDYHELFCVEDELKRQKEIEKNNLSGKKYVMPLSGVLLKKLYWTLKHHQLDRKFFKNNWFNTYYGPIFLESFLEQIEKNHILELYESGKIYSHPLFKTYQELYKKSNLKESDELASKTLTRTSNVQSKKHTKDKSDTKVMPPRNYIKLAKIKNDVGRIGEELVYNYEIENLKEYPELQNKVEKTYLINDGAGYDIKSYDIEENETFIEVKTNKSTCNNRIKFYISAREDEFICKHKNAYIYYIYDLEDPKLRVIDQQTYLSYYKKPINYEIDQEIIIK